MAPAPDAWSMMILYTLNGGGGERRREGWGWVQYRGASDVDTSGTEGVLISEVFRSGRCPD